MVVTGVSGLLGASFATIAASRFQVAGFYRRQAVNIPNVKTVLLDLTSDVQTIEQLNALRPSVLVHLAALTDVDYCESHPDESVRQNVETTRTLVEWCAKSGCRFVFMSTDSVFDGEACAYSEDRARRPVNEYARSKVAAEELVRLLLPNALIVRASIYGWNAQPKKSLAEWILQRLNAGDRVPGFADVWFSPLLVNTLSDILLILIEKGGAGTYHLASSNCVSKYDFAVVLAETFRHSPDRIERSALGRSSLAARRPMKTCLRTDKVRRDFGVELPSVRDDLERFESLDREGYPAQLKSYCVQQ